MTRRGSTDTCPPSSLCNNRAIAPDYGAVKLTCEFLVAILDLGMYAILLPAGLDVGELVVDGGRAARLVGRLEQGRSAGGVSLCLEAEQDADGDTYGKGQEAEVDEPAKHGGELAGGLPPLDRGTAIRLLWCWCCERARQANDDGWNGRAARADRTDRASGRRGGEARGRSESGQSGAGARNE